MTTTSRPAPDEVYALTHVLPEQFGIPDPATGRGNCIETTRVVTETLSRLHVTARALACDVGVFNAEARGLVDAHIPMTEWPPEAHSIGCRCDLAGQDETLTEPYRRGSGFGGHLVVAGDGWIADLTARQFSRPQHGIVIGGAIIAPRRPNPGLQLELADGAAIWWRWRPEIANWRRTPAWRQDIAPGYIDMLTERVRRRLAADSIPRVTIEESP